MRQILAFGDSNTCGLVPGSKPKERYPWDVRWTGILDNNCSSVRVIEEGLCGRTTAFEDDLREGRKGVSTLPLILETHAPIDFVIVMLGTNDCKSAYSVSAETIGKGMELCLDEIEKYLAADKILLISPILLGEEVWRPEKDPEFSGQSVETSHRLKDVYARIAKERGTAFLAASDYVRANVRDDEHLDEEGHRILASVIMEKLNGLGVL